MVRNLRGTLIMSRLGMAFPVVFIAACATAQTNPADEAGSGPTPEPAAATAGPSTFTVAQVELGEQEFSDSCSDCHSTSEFRGSDFQYRFRRRTAWHLYQVVTETMPEDAPGSLSPDSYVAVVSYILSMNGYEAGATPLSATEDALGALPLDQVPTHNEKRN